jgi:hypothetical protein
LIRGKQSEETPGARQCLGCFAGDAFRNDIAAFSDIALATADNDLETTMPRGIIPGLIIVLAIGGPTAKAYAQDPSARCVSVENEQMTIASARSRGLDIENFTEIETTAFLKAFNAAPPSSAFVAMKMFAAVGRDRAYVFFESGQDLCSPPAPLPRAIYGALVERARGEGA